MNGTCRGRTGFLAGCVAGVALLFASWVNPADAQLRVSADPDGDGVYVAVRDYPVAYEEALASFAETGGAPWIGEGPVLNAQGVEGVEFAGPQSWDGFLAFLDSVYGSSSLTNQPCDNTVNITPGSITWQCDGLPCAPQDQCRGFFHSGTAQFSCIQAGDPPCPTAKRYCLPNGNPIHIVAFDTVGGPACQCDPFFCVQGPGMPSGTGIMHDNTVCNCYAAIKFIIKYRGRPVGCLFAYRINGNLVATVTAGGRDLCQASPVATSPTGTAQFPCGSGNFMIRRQAGQFVWTFGRFTGTLCRVP